MSKQDLVTRVHQLYDVVEVNNIGGVPHQVASETIRLINPGLSGEQAEAIALDCDSRGKRMLPREDFTRAALMCLQNTDVSDAIGLVKDLTARMRVAFRRRFLMYDAPANEPPPGLLDNAKTVSMYRELFDLAARDADGISRSELHRVMQVLLPEYSVDASNVCKAALSDRETDLVGFYEFMMVVQPTTSRRCLSDMLAIARRELAGNKDDGFDAVASGVSRAKSLGASSSMMQTGAPTPNKSVAVGQRPVASAATGKVASDRLKQELQSYQMHEAIADQRASEALSSRMTLSSMPTIPAAPPPMKVVADEELERENMRLKLQVDDLQRENATLAGELRNMERAAAQSGGAARARSKSVNSSAHFDAAGSDIDDPDVAEYVKRLESELRQARARLAIASETTELSALLRRGDDVHQTVRHFYPDESVFIGKHRYLQEATRPFMDGVSPICTIIGQYDLLVVGYQSLYRQLRAKTEVEKKKSTFDPNEAARSIIPRQQPVTPARTRGSPSHSRASPMKWKDLDRAPTADMRGTGTLADPLLTDEERHTLRAKLAAQMRGSARYYHPAAAASASRSRTGSPAAWGSRYQDATDASVVAPAVMTSQASMHRLQHLAGRAQRARHLLE